MKILLLENNLLGIEYIEPYAGGASVALSLLYEDFASHVHINDINRGVYAFWYVALNDPNALCDRIMDTEVTVEEWQRQRAVQTAKDSHIFDLAFSTFFLNRTNRSGIISRGGIIGGRTQNGRWKLDARYNKENLCLRVQKVARFRTRITLTQEDAGVLMDRMSASAQGSALMYLDPPYYVKGRNLYDDFYAHRDHADIARRVRQLGCSWVVSYDAAPQILSFYGFARSLRYSLTYSAARSWRGAEVMFFSPGLRIPSLESASGISAEDVDRMRRQAFSA